MGIPEQEERDGNTRETQEPKQKGIDPLPVVNEKIANGQSQNPGDRRKDSSLGAVTLAVCKEGVVQKIGSRDKEQDQKISFRFPEDLNKSQESEDIEGRVEQKAVSLVEKIIEKCVEPHGQRRAQSRVFKSLQPFRGEDSLIYGDRGESPIDGMDEHIEQSQGQQGKKEKKQDLGSGPVFLEKIIHRHAKKGAKKQIILQPEPEEERQKKSQEEIVSKRERSPGPDFPVDVEGEEGNGNL